jgi:hypothetical protein
LGRPEKAGNRFCHRKILVNAEGMRKRRESEKC